MRAQVEARAWIAAWWRGEGGGAGSALRLLLSPVEAGFRAAVSARDFGYSRGLLRTERVAIPVISIGNVSVGGSGKTPMAAWLAARLKAFGRAPAIVLRGYGADEVSVHRDLNPGVPVHQGADRPAAARAAARAGADCIVLDDGFQHRRLHRDLDVVLVAAEQWSETRRLLPRGPWREPIESIRRADFVIVTRKSAPGERAAAVAEDLRRIAPGPGLGIARLTHEGLTDLRDTEGALRPLDEIAGQRVVVVTTLADPGPFMAQLRSAGASVESIEFDDHHEFTDAEIASIADRFSGRLGVVTRKEAVKLRDRLPQGVSAVVVEQGVEIEHGREALMGSVVHAVERSG